MNVKSFIKKALILLFILNLSPVFGQEFRRGAVLDLNRYNQVDVRPALLARNYTSLPRSASLKQNSPYAGDQGDYGTCVGWATAYAARTISESLAFNRTDRQQTSENVFSPIYVYKRIANDPTGQRGSYISDALNLMKNQGIVKQLPAEKTMSFRNISISMFQDAQRYPISGYVRLFSVRRGVAGTIAERVLPVKKSLSEGKPVIIGMNTPDSFFKAKDLWQPTESSGRDHGGHAMCVVGYDDDKYGGAFEVQNSWGDRWGNGGFTWITYRDFVSFVDEAYEIIENLAIYKDAVQYAASIEIQVFNSADGMPVTFDRQGFYKTRSSYPSGTDFRFLMTNRHPAYVYAFSADSTTPGTERIFPLRGVSPVMDYIDSTVAWPGEFTWIRLNETVGTDYLVVLFSKEELDIDAIQRRFASERGAFPDRVARAVGQNFIPYNTVEYNASSMSFSASSNNPRAVFALLLAIDHRAR